MYVGRGLKQLNIAVKIITIDGWPFRLTNLLSETRQMARENREESPVTRVHL